MISPVVFFLVGLMVFASLLVVFLNRGAKKEDKG